MQKVTYELKKIEEITNFLIQAKSYSFAEMSAILETLMKGWEITWEPDPAEKVEVESVVEEEVTE